MNHTEDLIKETLQRQADRALDPSVLLAGLEKARPPRRTSRGLLVGVAAAVVLLLVVAGVLFTREKPMPAAAKPPAPSSSLAAIWQQAMAYEPGWLPSGYVEMDRSANEISLDRRWASPPAPGPWTNISLTVSKTDRIGLPIGSTETVDINGVPAKVIAAEGQFSVFWQPKPNLWLLLDVNGEQSSRDVAVHVAKALRSDGTKRFRPLLALGWCPFAITGSSTAATDPNDSMGNVLCSKSTAPTVDVRVTVDNDPRITSGSKVTVRGRHGWYTETAERGQSLCVRLADRRYLCVEAAEGNHPGVYPLSKADMIRIADSVVIHDAAYVNWIRTR